MLRVLAVVILLEVPGTFALPPAFFDCTPTRKVDQQGTWSATRLRAGQWQIKVSDFDSSATIERCSYSSIARQVTCDDYRVDHVEVDQFIHARKYYVLGSKFDVQIFADLTFVENNGRGGIAFGTCRMTPGGPR